jgi:hypothetical protein
MRQRGSGGGVPGLGIGFLGVACAFGLTVLTMAYTRSVTFPEAI